MRGHRNRQDRSQDQPRGARPASAHQGSAWLLGLGLAALAGAVAIRAQAITWLPGWSQAPLFGLAALALLAAAWLRLSPEACESQTPAQRRRYLRAFLPPMAAYVLVLCASVWLLRRIDGPDWLRALVALAPVLPIGLAVRAIALHLRAIDELQQRIELEAISIATALVALGYLAGGFLQQARVIDVPAGVAMIWVFPLVCLVYGLAKAAVARRYR